VTERKIGLVVLDDHGLFRASLSRFLSLEPDLEIAGECGTCGEALDVLARGRTDVVLLDFDVGLEEGNDFIDAARAASYGGKFLIVAGSLDTRSAALCLKLGASGIFLKSQPPELLVRAIRDVAAGGLWVDSGLILEFAEQIATRLPPWDGQADEVLEDRERNVLLGILGGLTNRKIGDSMGLSESSVKGIVQRLFGKTGVKTRSQLVRVALEGSLGSARQMIYRQENIGGHSMARHPTG
jgi:DNA-binding NarL/FixJ family response regulator